MGRDAQDILGEVFSHLRKQITGIEQRWDEAYPEYFERFQSLLTQCPQHGLSEESLLTAFYDGLLPIEISWMHQLEDRSWTSTMRME